MSSISKIISSITSQGVVVPVTTPVSFPYLALPTDYAIMVNSSAPHTINLPVSPVTGREYVIKDISGNSGANAITVEGNGKTIDGQTSYTIQQNYGFVELIYNGTEWNIINS